MLHLLCVPAGYSVEDYLIKKIRGQKYEDTVLVASSNALVQKFRMQAVNAVNFDYLAKSVLDQCNPGQGSRQSIQKISRKTQELILQDILDGLLQKGQLLYFGKLIRKNGFIRSLASLMEQLGSSGATPEEVETAFSHWDGRPAQYCQKDREVAAIYGEYIRYLINHNVYDMAGLYRLATEGLAKLVNSGGRLKWDSLFVLGFYQFDTLQLGILQSLSRCCEVWVALPYEEKRPELYRATEATYGQLMSRATRQQLSLRAETGRKPALQHLLMSLRNPKARPVSADDSIEIWQLADQTEEMRAVLREIKKQLRMQRVKPAEIAVVVRRMENYSGIRALCDAYGIPVQMKDNAAVVANPVFRYVISFLETVSAYGRKKVECWVSFLSFPLQRIAVGLDPETAAQLAGAYYYTDCNNFLSDLLQQSGCSTLQLLWQEIGKIPREAPLQEYCDRTERILSLLDLKRKAGSLYQNGEVSLAALKNIACACDAIAELLKKLPWDYRFSEHKLQRITCAQFAEALNEAAADISLPLQPENMEGIAVLAAVNLEGADFKQVYVMGLRENEFPLLKNENWIYTDSERADLTALGIVLPVSADGIREDIRFLFNACAAAEDRLVLTFYVDEEHNASPYISEIRSLFTNLPVQVRKAQVSAAASLSRQELELALARAGRRKVLQQIEPGLTAGIDCDRKRVNNEQDWNGNFADLALIQQISQQTGKRFSASKLETYRNCPFKFLVNYVWRQKAAETAGEEIDPMRRGSLLHSVLENFIQNHLEEQLQSSRYDVLQQELDAIFDKTWQDFAAKGLLYPGDFWQHDKELQRSLLHRWLHGEISYSEAGELRPVCTEKEFGRNDTDEMALDINGCSIYLNGKIDRIDRAGSSYFITDYKSGAAPKKEEFADSDLQLPLYLLAAEKLLAEPEKAAVAGGGYLSLKEGERKESFLLPGTGLTLPGKNFATVKDADGNTISVTDIHDLEATIIKVLAKLLERMGQGIFTPTPFPGCDKYCPGAVVCRYRLIARNREEVQSNG